MHLIAYIISNGNWILRQTVDNSNFKHGNNGNEHPNCLLHLLVSYFLFGVLNLWWKQIQALLKMKVYLGMNGRQGLPNGWDAGLQIKWSCLSQCPFGKTIYFSSRRFGQRQLQFGHPLLELCFNLSRIIVKCAQNVPLFVTTGMENQSSS